MRVTSGQARMFLDRKNYQCAASPANPRTATALRVVESSALTSKHRGSVASKMRHRRMLPQREIAFPSTTVEYSGCRPGVGGFRRREQGDAGPENLFVERFRLRGFGKTFFGYR